MKPALIIGSTCVDLILTMDRLPKTGDDIEPTSQTMTIGGCAYNVSHMLRLLGAAHLVVHDAGADRGRRGQPGGGAVRGALLHP